LYALHSDYAYCDGWREEFQASSTSGAGLRGYSVAAVPRKTQCLQTTLTSIAGNH
jgi:hypothetical protein